MYGVIIIIGRWGVESHVVEESGIIETWVINCCWCYRGCPVHEATTIIIIIISTVIYIVQSIDILGR